MNHHIVSGWVHCNKAVRANPQCSESHYHLMRTHSQESHAASQAGLLSHKYSIAAVLVAASVHAIRPSHIAASTLKP